MSFNSDTPRDPIAAVQPAPSIRKNSYSRKRRSAFETWQEHARKSAGTVSAAFPERHDRDLRRTVVTG